MTSLLREIQTLLLVQVDLEQMNMKERVVKDREEEDKEELRVVQGAEEEVLGDLKGLLHLQGDLTLLPMVQMLEQEDLEVLTLSMVHQVLEDHL